MAFGAQPDDSNNVPISSVYVPNTGFVALQGSSSTNTDGGGNTSTAAILSETNTQSSSGTLQSAQSGNANGTPLNVLGYASIVFTVNMSSFTGTINFEGTEDNTNYDPIYVTQSGTNTITTTVTGSTTTSIHIYEASCSNLQSVRARTSSVSAGNATVTARCTPLPLIPSVINANIVSALPAGSNLIGNVELVDSGGTNKASISSGGALKVDNSAVTQPVSGTVSITANSSVNVAQIAGAATDTNSGNKSAGTQRIVIATDQPQLTNALKVDGSAVTQPVSGTVTANAGTGTFNNQQSNITTDYDTGAGTQTMTMFGVALPASGGAVAGGTSSNPLRIDPSGTTTQPVSGTVTANAGTNLNTSALALESGGNLATLAGGVSSSKYQTNLAQVGGSSVATAATGVQKVGVVGSGGATIDGTVGAGTAPTNAVVIGTVYNSSAPAPTNGQAMALQADQAGNARVFPGIALATLSAWNSSSSLNATQNIFTNSGAEAVLVQLTQTSTLTAGAVTFEVSYDGSNWLTIPANCVLDPTSTTFPQISLPYTVQASTNKVFLLNMNGAQGLRIKLSTQITGTGTVTPNYALLPFSPSETVIAYSPTAANFNVSAVQSGTWTAVPNAATSGGSTPSHTITASSTNPTSLKGSAGQVWGFCISNSNASARFFKLYDKSSAPTVGTDTPKMTVQVPGGSTVTRAFPVGLAFPNGIGWGITTGIADNDTGSVGTDISVDIDYK